MTCDVLVVVVSCEDLAESLAGEEIFGVESGDFKNSGDGPSVGWKARFGKRKGSELTQDSEKFWLEKGLSKVEDRRHNSSGKS
jgi:hypothetical protein